VTCCNARKARVKLESIEGQSSSGRESGKKRELS
jgi:hypothetical protein